jgi:hypothetical protein
MITISHGNFARVTSAYRPYLYHAPRQVEFVDPWAGFFSNRQCQQSGELLQQAWTGLLAGIDSRTQSPRGVSEIGRNQSFQAGDKSIQVDGNGSVQVEQQGHLHGLLAAFSQSSPAHGSSRGVAFLGTVSLSRQLKFENGQISLPNGQKIPFGNCGAIVVMADGSQVGAGRNSENSSQQIRTAYAGPGEKIPTSPPGRTNVYHLNEAGDIVRQEVV